MDASAGVPATTGILCDSAHSWRASGSSVLGSAGLPSVAGSAPGSERGGGSVASLESSLQGLSPTCKGSRLAKGSCTGVSWRSGGDSAAGLGAGGCAGAGGSAGSSGAWDEQEEWGEDVTYGSDVWQAPWRRPEGLPVGWILLVLLAAVAINVGVGVSNTQRRAQAPAPPPAAAAAAGPPLMPPLPPPPSPLRKRRRVVTLPPPLPPHPPPPPPAFCEVAPPNLARARFSNTTAVFQAPIEHYLANLIDRKGADHSRRYPAYYNGVVDRFCIVGVEAVYTCLREDNPCNYAPEVALRLCEKACADNANRCQRVQGLAGHPLQTRICGLFGLSKPSCLNIGFTATKQRQMKAFYKLNLCQAPPGASPPPRPPLPPAQPPPPLRAPGPEYYK